MLKPCNLPELLFIKWGLYNSKATAVRSLIFMSQCENAPSSFCGSSPSERQAIQALHHPRLYQQSVQHAIDPEQPPKQYGCERLTVRGTNARGTINDRNPAT